MFTEQRLAAAVKMLGPKLSITRLLRLTSPSLSHGDLGKESYELEHWVKSLHFVPLDAHSRTFRSVLIEKLNSFEF